MPDLIFRAFYAVYGKVRRAKCLPFCCMERKHARCSCVTGSLLNLLLMASLWKFLDRVVRVCLQNFNFLPIESQLEIRTAKFLQAFLRQRIHCVCYLNSVQSRSSIVLIFFKWRVNKNELVGRLLCFSSSQSITRVSILSPLPWQRGRVSRRSRTWRHCC